MRTISCVAVLSLASFACAADNELTPREKTDGWRLLFDGKSLNGWMTSAGKESKTPVEEGSLNPHKCGHYMLVHREMWENFVFACDFKISRGCNSGIFIRTFSLTPRPGKDVGFNGLEIAIDDTPGADLHDTGALYDLVKPSKAARKPTGEWNHIVITSNKNLIEVELNGEKVTRMDTDEWTKPNVRPDGTPHKFDIAYKDHPRRGYIGLQDHGANCWFKNIKLKELTEPGVVSSEFLFTKAPFPECHAATIEETKQGLVAAWFAGTREKDPDVGIWFSRHDGRAWSAPVEIADGRRGDTALRGGDTALRGEKRYPTWNPVLFQMPGGPLQLFFKVGPSPNTWWGELMTSDDGGKSWSKPRRLPDGILGPIKNRPLLLADGTLLCGSSTEHNGWRVHLESTRDGGKTWKHTEPFNDGRKLAAIQPTFLQHPGGKLQILCRTKQQRIAEAWSEDGGKTWSELKLTGLPNPNSGIHAVTLKDGRHLLIYNDSTRDRSPLNVAVSPDGRSWQAGPVLESEPGEYSYPTVMQAADGQVHVIYTWQRQRIKHVILDPAKLALGKKL